MLKIENRKFAMYIPATVSVIKDHQDDMTTIYLSIKFYRSVKKYVDSFKADSSKYPQLILLFTRSFIYEVIIDNKASSSREAGSKPVYDTEVIVRRSCQRSTEKQRETNR